MRSVVLGSFVFLLGVLRGQEPFAWPEELQIDPSSYELKRLGVKEIIQYKTFDANPKEPDNPSRSSTFLNYVISYDTLHRISSLKYGFENYLPYSHFAGDSSALDSLKSIAIQKNQPIYFLKLNGEWVAQLYWEVVFSYASYGISRLEILNPYDRLQTFRVLDGVYLGPKSYDEVYIKNYFDELGELIQTDTYANDLLVRRDSFFYTTYTRNGWIARLLTQSVIDGNRYSIEYLFED
jgi:hypothetical protein